jgi:hypothetical protein
VGASSIWWSALSELSTGYDGLLVWNTARDLSTHTYKLFSIMLRYCCCSCQWGETVSEPWPPAGLLFIPQVIYEYGEQWWNDTDSGKPNNWEKPVPVPLCPPKIPHGLIWVWTWASVVRDWWLTAWAMSWSCQGIAPSEPVISDKVC